MRAPRHKNHIQLHVNNSCSYKSCHGNTNPSTNTVCKHVNTSVLASVYTWSYSPLSACQHWPQHRLGASHISGDHWNWLTREGSVPTVHSGKQWSPHVGRKVFVQQNWPCSECWLQPWLLWGPTPPHHVHCHWPSEQQTHHSGKQNVSCRFLGSLHTTQGGQGLTSSIWLGSAPRSSIFCTTTILPVAQASMNDWPWPWERIHIITVAVHYTPLTIF